MHLFCCFLDEKIPPTNPLYADRAFTAEHFAVFPLNLSPGTFLNQIKRERSKNKTFLFFHQFLHSSSFFSLFDKKNRQRSINSKDSYHNLQLLSFRSKKKKKKAFLIHFFSFYVFVFLLSQINRLHM